MPDPFNSFEPMDGDFFSYNQLLWKKVLADGKDSVLTSKDFTIPTTEKVTDWYVVIKVGCWNTAGDNTPTFDFLFDNISLIDITNGTSVAQINNNLNFSVFPNPSSGIINIKSNSNLVNYDIYNLLGTLVKTGSTINQIDLTSLNKGTYIIKLGNNSSAEFHKLVLK